MKDHYTYRVMWSAEDGEHVGLCAEFPSLSWLAASPEAALKGIRKVVVQVVDDLQQSGEEVPEPFSDRSYSGRFMVRVLPEVHRGLAIRAAEQGVSLNRFIATTLAERVGAIEAKATTHATVVLSNPLGWASTSIPRWTAGIATVQESGIPTQLVSITSMMKHLSTIPGQVVL
jgi:predicted HicB family RNase H-like nuclease